LAGNLDGFGAVARAELAEDPGNFVANRAFREPEAAGDLLAGEAFGGGGEDVTLSV
jgi:hypothetical protein